MGSCEKLFAVWPISPSTTTCATWIPCGQSSRASDWTRPRKANFALLNPSQPPPRTLDVAPVKSITPSPAAIISSAVRCAQTKAPKAVIRHDCSNCANVVPATPSPPAALALWMRTPIGPSSTRTRAIAAINSLGIPTSAVTASAAPPAFLISFASLSMNSGERAISPT